MAGKILLGNLSVAAALAILPNIGTAQAGAWPGDYTMLSLTRPAAFLFVVKLVQGDCGSGAGCDLHVELRHPDTQNAIAVGRGRASRDVAFVQFGSQQIPDLHLRLSPSGCTFSATPHDRPDKARFVALRSGAACVEALETALFGVTRTTADGLARIARLSASAQGPRFARAGGQSNPQADTVAVVLLGPVLDWAGSLEARLSHVIRNLLRNNQAMVDLVNRELDQTPASPADKVERRLVFIENYTR